MKTVYYAIAATDQDDPSGSCDHTTKAPLDNKVVRQAFAYAIDRNQASTKGESGYEPPGNQTGVLSPTLYDAGHPPMTGVFHLRFETTPVACARGWWVRGCFKTL